MAEDGRRCFRAVVCLVSLLKPASSAGLQNSELPSCQHFHIAVCVCEERTVPTCPCGVEFAAEVRTPLYPAFTIADAQHQQVAERSPGESGESIPCLCFSVGLVMIKAGRAVCPARPCTGSAGRRQHVCLSRLLCTLFFASTLFSGQ